MSETTLTEQTQQSKTIEKHPEIKADSDKSHGEHEKHHDKHDKHDKHEKEIKWSAMTKNEKSEYLKHWVNESILVFIGVILAGVGLECFIVPNRLLDGGVTGISLLVTELTGWSLPVLIFVLNLPFMVLAYKQVSKDFAIKTFLAILLLSIFLTFIHFPIVTNDKLLIAVFGGFFIGGGIGFAMRGSSVLDGTEVLALYLSRMFSMQVSELILIINIFIFIVAAFVFNLETALYSILTYAAASKTVDFITQGVEEYIGVTIISEQNEKIRKAIIRNMGRGVTTYKGRRGLTGKKAKAEGLDDIDIIYTIVTKLELSRLRREIDNVDRTAFIMQSSISGVKGGMIKKRALH